MKLYRLMKSENGVPKIGSSFGCLGVRVAGRGTSTTFDIVVDSSGMVHLGDQGLSTFKDPDLLGTYPKLDLYSIEVDELGSGLAVVPSSNTPGRFHIVPSRTMTLQAYELALADTRELWQLEA